MAAGSVVITEEMFASVKLIKFVCTMGTAGTPTASGTTTNIFGGKLLFFVTVPGSGGDAPTDNYDITILDKNSVDVLGDTGLNRATATTESILEASLGAVANSSLKINVVNAGSANISTVYLWIR